MIKPYQLPKKTYFKSYDDKERWTSYWYQINSVIKTNSKNILEIGVGNKTVSTYLKNRNIKITTVDINPSLKPNYVLDVTKLTQKLKQNSFDCVLCAEVLEHIPFKYFEKALEQIKQITSEHAIISLPYSALKMKISFKISLFKEKIFYINFPFPLFHKYDGHHYWEVGKKGYNFKKIIKIIKRKFKIEKYFLVPEHQDHMFFILKLKDDIHKSK